MVHKEMVTIFCGIGIPDNMSWLGAIEKADKINGMINNSNCWIVFFREHGQL